MRMRAGIARVWAQLPSCPSLISPKRIRFHMEASQERPFQICFCFPCGPVLTFNAAVEDPLTVDIVHELLPRQPGRIDREQTRSEALDLPTALLGSHPVPPDLAALRTFQSRARSAPSL